MTKNKTLAYVLVAVAAVALIGVGVASAYGPFNSERVQAQLDKMIEKGVITQEQADERLERIEERHQIMLEDMASVVGLTADELEAEFEQGKNLLEIAEEQGISEEQLQEEMKAIKIERITEHLNQLVKDGEITQEEADEKFEVLEERMENCGCKGGFRGGGGERGPKPFGPKGPKIEK